jgi:hypothetical protein
MTQLNVRLKMNTRSLTEVPKVDLTRILLRVQANNPDWDNFRLNAAKLEYLRFLQLCKVRPDTKISAPPDVDEIWHAHILDTTRYIADCQNYFGYFLHHDPCIGPSDMANAELTLQIYRDVFNLGPSDVWFKLMTCANPGGGCGSISAH